MSESNIEERTSSKSEQWRERIAEHERSGISVKQFCKERGLTECSFYAWRKRLRTQRQLVRFALVEREPAARQGAKTEAHLELVLVNGARLRIGAGADSTTLRMVLEALRV